MFGTPIDRPFRRTRSFGFRFQNIGAGSHLKGKIICKGRHIRAGTLDSLVLTNLKQQLFAPDRLAALLHALQVRHSTQAESVGKRRLGLQREIADCDERLKRLYRSIEDGVVDEDPLLRERIGELRTKKEQAAAALDRMKEQSRSLSFNCLAMALGSA